MKKDILEDKKKLEMKQKAKWTVLLFLALVSFLSGLMTQNNIYFLITIVLAFCIKKYGYSILFKEYDDKKKAKIRKFEESMGK